MIGHGPDGTERSPGPRAAETPRTVGSAADADAVAARAEPRHARSPAAAAEGIPRPGRGGRAAGRAAGPGAGVAVHRVVGSARRLRPGGPWHGDHRAPD